ncbi:MAG: trehalase [Chlamydiia bacterium]|nr:trehalase [Chlamydiia bacterium]
MQEWIQVSGPLFERVQKEGLFKDGKTFVDALPRSNPQEILKAFEKERDQDGFDLSAFIQTHFTLPDTEEDQIPKASNMKDYISKMWTILLKEMEAPSPYSSLISLPHPHIVPGGRFRECFYWDSYFTALGLLESGHLNWIKNMVENFTFLIENLGFIPNGNRVYFASRSQPPYFALLLTLLYEAGEKDFALSHIPSLEKEYRYWMNHTLSLPEGFQLNHYFDALNIPRPEAYKREMELSKQSENPQFFRHLRAACASGWDFSSRWLEDQKSFSTIWALDILPIDLNCLLYSVEETLARFSKNPSPYAKAAKERKQAIQKLFWKKNFFFDYHAKTKRHTATYSLAATTPLFVKAATDEQADLVAKKLEKDFLLKGGFVTSLTEGIHQWDMPNGWAPLEWITIQGLLNYGYTDLALEGARRWLALNEKIFQEKGTLLEKYNVRDCTAQVARGEYELQQGFGWTNGVALTLMEIIN